MKLLDTTQAILSAVAAVNVCATVFVYLNPSNEREGKLWQLYTASVTGLYGFVLANDRLTSKRVKQAQDERSDRDGRNEIDGNM